MGRKVDFLSQHSSDKKGIYPSPGVLGQLYREFKKNIDHEKLIEEEYEYKILRKYRMMDVTKWDPDFGEHLAWAYNYIVLPLNESIRMLMRENKLTSEHELYSNCANFSKLFLFSSEGDHGTEISEMLYEAREEFMEKIKAKV